MRASTVASGGVTLISRIRYLVKVSRKGAGVASLRIEFKEQHCHEYYCCNCLRYQVTVILGFVFRNYVHVRMAVGHKTV